MSWITGVRLLLAILIYRPKDLKHVLKIDVMVKQVKGDVQWNFTKPVVVKGISRIKPMLRNLEAIEVLFQSQLFNQIIHPDPKNFQLIPHFRDFYVEIQNHPAIK